MEISYYQKDGRVGVFYNLDIEEIDEFLKSGARGEAFNICDLTEIDMGLAPNDVQRKGKASIKEYALKVCRTRHEKKIADAYKIVEQKRLRQSTVDRPIEIEHESGITLHGRMLSNDKGYGVRVFLEKPYKSRTNVLFNYPTCRGESVCGYHVFDDFGNLTQRVIGDSRNALIDLYDAIVARRRHGKEIDLVSELNRTRHD